MADSHHVAGRRQHRPRRQTAASENLDWEPRRAESRHSLPYRARQPEIQRPDRRRPKYPSQRPRASEDFLDTRSMPTPARLLTRPATPKSRGRRAHDDDDDDEDSEKERLRGRLRSRSRVTWGANSRATSRAKSKVKSRRTSRSSQSTDSTAAPTPTRSSYGPMRTAPSAPSLGPSSGSSSDDSDDESSGSFDDYHGKTRTLKERMNGTPDSEPVPNPISRSQSRSRPKSQDRLVPEIESAEDSEDQVVSHHPRIIVRKSSLSRHRQAHQSRSPSRAPRHHRRSDRHSEAPPSPPSRRTPKKYYHSEVSYPQKQSFSRSRATSATRMTSQSMGSSSKQSMGNYFQTSAPLQPYDKGSKIHACIECGDAIPAKELAKLECGHRWCKKCLKKRFKASIKDTQNRPPTCCTSEIIPLKHVSHIFDDGFKESWNDKFGMNRNYCPRPKCREWIQQEDHRHHSNGRTSATCRKCNTRICGVCYNKWHEAKHCPTDRDATQFMNRAKDAGWKRCFNCQALVESKEGYNHTVCPCGAQFCMACGSEWGGCRCPLYNNHVDEDELSHAPAPMVSRERLGGTDGLPRSQRPGFSYAPESQHHRGHPDEDRARRAQHAAAAAAAAAADDDEDDDDDDDDYLNDMGDVAGIGNAPGHFMSDYRRRSHVTVPPVSLPTAPLPPASVQLERSKSGANYVSGVNKARGVRGPSMERLADRFSEQRQTFNPNHRPFGPPMAPFTAPPLGMGPLPHQPPMPPSPISRRHTMDDDTYGIPFDPRYAQPSLSRRATTHPFMDDFAVHPPMGRRRYRMMEPPRPSELAGLTGPGSGMNRVFEWMNHVDPYLPDNQTVA